MPIIIVEAGSVSKDKKEMLVKNLTDTAAEVTGIPHSSYTVLIKENPIENWGVGGVPLAAILKERNR